VRSLVDAASAGAVSGHDRQGWHVLAYNGDWFNTATVTVYAICARQRETSTQRARRMA
jgi:hypothetical protein